MTANVTVPPPKVNGDPHLGCWKKQP